MTRSADGVTLKNKEGAAAPDASNVLLKLS
jgi:hypothetical protein